ncbi:Molybdopterin synthase sulfur carrier subunit [Hypsizygus marmoreus]|uniref:Molybdopterin synthase sulfur carrier subunit n=1 Tax=Hypsizygus marmoreus TaxID=39966 RepID=A0A369JMV4_HYPMA|nr:Molybdopterin synthase sulfur carrier subunit [Hypsizygus marmoreus]
MSGPGTFAVRTFVLRTEPDVDRMNVAVLTAATIIDVLTLDLTGSYILECTVEPPRFCSSPTQLSTVFITTTMPKTETPRTITVLYFAAASTATNITEESVPLPDGQFFLSSLGDVLVSRHPTTALGKVLEGSQWSVDAEMVDDPTKVELKGGEEVAVICPVSGG